MKLITKRLIIREMSKKDADDMVLNVGNINVSKYLALVPHPYGKKDALWWINDCIKKSKITPRTSYELVIEDKSTKKMIGAIGISGIDTTIKRCNIGYWLGEQFWNNGIMTEALDKVLDFLFNKLKINRVQAHVFKDNIGSSKLLEKYGFKREGLHMQAGYSKALNKTLDEYTYALLKSDYVKNNQR